MPSAALLQQVKADLDEKREIAVDIRVLAPAQVSQEVSLELQAEDGYSFESVKAAVEQALETYFNGERLGENLLLAKLGSIIFGVPGVANYHLLAPTEDVAIEPTELPVLQQLTVSQMEE